MTARRRGNARSRRSCCFYTLIVCLLLLSVAGGMAAWFYSHPISSDALHERVVRRLERISGLDVAYDSATFTLSTGKYRISNLRLTDTGNPEMPVLTIGEVLATIRPWEVLSSREAVLKDVVLKDPTQLDLVYTEDSIKLGKRSQFLVDSVRNAQPPDSGAGGDLPISNLRIENVDLALGEAEGILPELTTAHPDMVFKGDLTLSKDKGEALTFAVDGSILKPSDDDDNKTTTVASGVKATGELDSDRLHLKMQADRIALEHVFRALPQTSVRGEQIKLDMTSTLQKRLQTVKGLFTAGRLAYNSPEKNFLLRDENLQVNTDLDVNTSSGRTIIRLINLSSGGANATLSGEGNFKYDRNFDARLTADSLNKDYRVLLESLLPQGWDVQAERNSFAVDLHLVGSSSGIDSADGKLAVRGAHLIMPGLAVALKNLHGDINFKPDEIRFVDMTGEYAGTRVAVDGDFKGDPWGTGQGNLDATWSTIIPLHDVLALHGNQFVNENERLSGSGDIKGNGTWKQAFNLKDPAGSGIPEVNGAILFNDVGIKYNALPAPIAGLNGSIRVSGNRLTIETLVGSMQGNELDVAGEIVGKDYFWRDPVVSASLQSRMDLANIGPYLSESQADALRKYQVSGRAETELLLRGSLADFKSGFTGRVKLTNLSFAPNLDFMRGSFSDVNGLVTWDGTDLELEGLTGRLNDQELKLRGKIASEQVKLAIETATDLKFIEQTFPELDHYLDMSGGLACDLTMTMGSKEESMSSGSITQVLEAARVLTQQSVKEKGFVLNGKLHFDNASIRHVAMPPARKEGGRSIPEGRIHGLTGTVNVENDTLFVSADNTVSCAFADTSNCRMSGSIKFRPQDFPEVKVKISTGKMLKLDTWAMGWGKEIPKPDNPLITHKKFNLDAELSAPSVVFRGQEAGRSLGKLSFDMVQDNTPRVTTFKEVVVQGNRPGMGRVIGSGTIESYVWNERAYPKWTTKLDVQSMPLETMLAAVFNDPANIRGIVSSGNLDIQGVGTNALSIRGQGSGLMQNLEIGGTAVIRQLGATTGRNFGGMQFQTARAATFQIGNGALSSRDLALETNGLQLDMRGDYWFAGDPSRNIAPKTINGMLRLRLFKSVFGNIPIIAQMAELADDMTNALLVAFRVTGNADDPRVTPIALPAFQGAT